jgi:hypothetical protein
MAYVIYNKQTTQTVRSYAFGKEYYETEAAAKAGITRLAKKGKIVAVDHAVAELSYFRDNIEKYETVRNLMTGELVQQRVNTPYYLSVANETYWSV